MVSRWNKAITQARRELGYGPHEYIPDWDSVVDEAKAILAYEREEKQSYKEYMESPEWIKLRGEAYQRANHKCEFCGAPAAAAHHVFYPEDFQNDCLENLMVLCKVHHDMAHKKVPIPQEIQEAMWGIWMKSFNDFLEFGITLRENHSSDRCLDLPMIQVMREVAKK